MIQLQVRIVVEQGGGDITLETDVLEREDANGGERRIANAIESVHRKVYERIFEDVGGELRIIGDLDNCSVCRDIGRVVCPGCNGVGNSCARCDGQRVLPCPACNLG
ncbi:MAG: hypothetical protein ACOC9Z_08945 [Chloroflexota bacterium]